MNNNKKLKKLKKLLELKENGIINEENYEILKSKIINKKPFKLKRKALIILTIAFVIIASALTVSANFYIKHIDTENEIKAVQVVTQKREQEAKQKLQVEKDNYLKIEGQWLDTHTLLMNELYDFYDSAFRGVHYINMPNYNNDWIKELDTIKVNLDLFNSYTNQLISAPPYVQDEINKHINSFELQHECRFNDFVLMIKKFNKQIDDYNNWALKLNETGGKYDYLDSYTAGGYSSEIDFDGDGKKANWIFIGETSS